MNNDFRIDNVPVPNELPLIALKNTVLFPKVVIPLIVQRPKSIGSLESAMASDRLVVFVTQKNNEDEVLKDDIYEIGTLGRIISVFKLPDGSSKVDVEGLLRVRINNFTSESPFFRVSLTPFILQSNNAMEEKALLRRVIDQFKLIAEMRSYPSVLPEFIYMLSQLKDPEQIISLIIANLNLDISDQQRILNMSNLHDALKQLNLYLTRESQLLETERDVAKETKKQINKMQKELFLREQLKSIEKELGVDEEKEETNVLRNKILAAKMPKNVEDKSIKELNRLEKMPPFNPEVSYIRSYLDWLVELPWVSHNKSKINLKDAAKILNEQHYGLPKAKERILEYLAVQKQVGKLKGPILCFFGPPGTGKTSIGQSIAQALGRKFIRVSLGGLKDEAEIRGHRRTYVGAMPGRIIQGIHSSKSKNPVFMLDEIDKIGMDFRGDPSAALLEALDPQQNFSFSDHYLEVPYDLSDVLFITTANSLDTIPPALRDRLEIIEFNGYTEEEKFNIARKFLLPKLISDHGLKKSSLTISDGALYEVIRSHTKEAGVRELNRQLSAIARKVTKRMVETPSLKKVVIKENDISKYLGSVKYSARVAEVKDEVGVVAGLGWTPYGGEVLQIEATKMPGRGRLILTGHLGDVMKESAQAALSYARAKVAYDGKLKEDFNKNDVHIHVPAGAIRKDGPSAGITMTTALVSLLLNKPVRHEVAMTGEVTLRGKVLEIGGLKEKVLAAHRAGMKIIVVPTENRKDLEEIPKEVKKDLKFIFAKTMDDVLRTAIRQ